MRTATTSSPLTYTPTSPLSLSPVSTRAAAMQSQRSPNGRSRRPNQDFQLPIPRFHPAVYQSPSSSNASSAVTSPRNLRSPSSLKPPTSPRQQQRQYHNEAQQLLYEYQRELLKATGASGSDPVPNKLPGTPSIPPCRSPGEATPLTLEDGPSDYLTAGAARRNPHADASSQRDLVERMIREEEARHQGLTSGPSSAPVSPVARS